MINLENIHPLTDFKRNVKQFAADKQIANILNRLPMLAQFPDMGQIRDDLGEKLRSFPIKPYIVFYTKLDDGIEVVRILHQSRDIDRLFS